MGLPPVHDTSQSIVPYQEFPTETCLPANDLVMRYVFMDGSAQFQHTKLLTISAAAVLHVQHLDDNGTTVFEGLLPGSEHSSCRGEAFALLRALESTYLGIFFSDCASVIDVYEQLVLAARNKQSMPVVEHSDIWPLIWKQILQRGDNFLLLCKVTIRVSCKRLKNVGGRERTTQWTKWLSNAF